MLTSLESLLKQAEDNDIPIYELPMRNADSLVADMGNDHAAICLDANIPSEKVAAERAAHELGHVFTGTYYDSPYCANNRPKMEYRANAWMVKRLLPPAKIQRAFSHGCNEVWAIAEFCDCTENLVRTALNIYHSKGLL